MNSSVQACKLIHVILEKSMACKCMDLDHIHIHHAMVLHEETFHALDGST